jgi:hypothetical protein
VSATFSERFYGLLFPKRPNPVLNRAVRARRGFSVYLHSSPYGRSGDALPVGAEAHRGFDGELLQRGFSLGAWARLRLRLHQARQDLSHEVLTLGHELLTLPRLTPLPVKHTSAVPLLEVHIAEIKRRERCGRERRPFGREGRLGRWESFGSTTLDHRNSADAPSLWLCYLRIRGKSSDVVKVPGRFPRAPARELLSGNNLMLLAILVIPAAYDGQCTKTCVTGSFRASRLKEIARLARGESADG